MFNVVNTGSTLNNKSTHYFHINVFKNFVCAKPQNNSQDQLISRLVIIQTMSPNHKPIKLKVSNTWINLKYLYLEKIFTISK